MRNDIQAALSEEWYAPFELAAPRWMGAFTPHEILIAVRACTEDDRCLYFEVQSEGRLYRVEEESPLVADCIFQRVRIVAAASQVWHIDPDPAQIDTDWRIWAYGARPLARLQWDPGEWTWHDPYEPDAPGSPFFQYTVRVGRHILSARRSATPAAAEHWRLQGLTHEFLADFWTHLWASRQARRVSTFQWLVAHRGATVGSWLVYSGACRQLATQRHYLWDCPQAQ